MIDLLLDTHIWLRWLAVGNRPLPSVAIQQIEESVTVAVSAISIWEAAQLYRRGRINIGIAWEQWLALALSGSDVRCLPITEKIAAGAGLLPEHHRDPADRLIIATAIEHHMPLLSFDEQFSRYTELRDLLISQE